MNAQPYQAPQKFDAPEPVAERQTCGYIISVMMVIGAIFMTLGGISYCALTKFQYGYVFTILSGISLAAFHIMALSSSDYLKGKPSLAKLAPLFASSILMAVANIITKPDPSLYAKIGLKFDAQAFEAAHSSNMVSAVFMAVISMALGYFAYGSDDESGSCWLCFKPWIHKRPVMMMPAYGQGYPPQGYPQQPRQ